MTEIKGEFQVEPTDGGSAALAYERLRNAILKGDLPAGSKLSQVALASRFGVSRTPLREAVRRLQSEGLLDSEHNRQVRVPELDLADLENLYAMCILLEGLAVRLTVPHLTASDLESARQCLDEHERLIDREEYELARRPHLAFHAVLYAKGGDRLAAQCRSIREHSDRYRVLRGVGRAGEVEFRQLTQEEHERIYAEAAAGNAEECARVVALHLGRTALATFSKLDWRYDPVAIRTALELAVSAPAVPR
jgi:DNA-binding GntR family transcriptional regulator